MQNQRRKGIGGTVKTESIHIGQSAAGVGRLGVGPSGAAKAHVRYSGQFLAQGDQTQGGAVGRTYEF